MEAQIRQARPGPVPAVAWVMLGVLVVFYFLNSIDRGVISLIVGPVKHDLHIGDVRMSLLMGVGFALFYAVCGVPFGWIVDRFSRRAVLYFGITFWSLATVAAGMAHSFNQLLIARMALGVGEATLGPAAHSLIADRFPKERLATALSIFTLGSVAGTGGSLAVGGLVVGYFMRFGVVHAPLFGDVRPWQAVFFLVGLPGLLIATLVFLFREPARVTHPSRAATHGELLAFLRGRWAVLLCFTGTFAVMSMVVYGVNLWMPTYMERHFGWGPSRAGPIVGLLNVLGAGAGTFLGGVASDRLFAAGYKDAHLRVFIGGALLGAPVGVVGFLLSNPTLVLVCMTWMVLMTFSFIGYGAAAVQAVAPPALRGRMAAFYLLALVLIGGAGGPSLVAVFTDVVFHDPRKIGLAIALTIAVTTPVAIASACLGLGPMRRAVATLTADSH